MKLDLLLKRYNKIVSQKLCGKAFKVGCLGYERNNTTVSTYNQQSLSRNTNGKLQPVTYIIREKSNSDMPP